MRNIKRLRINDSTHIPAKLLSEIIGITPQQIRELDRAGIFFQTAHGVYDLVRSIQAWSAYLESGKVNDNRFHQSLSKKAGYSSKQLNSNLLEIKEKNIINEKRLDNELMLPLGIPAFDKRLGGLDRNVFNIVEAANINAALATLGHFIQHGLDNNERVVIVSLENPKLLFSKLKRFDFNFESYLENEQLIYLYYKPNYAHSLNLSTNYQFLLNEIFLLGGNSISRVVFDNVDVLFNLQSLFLARASAAKIQAATSNGNCTMLGVFVSSQNEDIQNLKAASLAFIPSYLAIKKIMGKISDTYSLVWEKSLSQHPDSQFYIQLKEGHGFVEESKS